MGERLDSEHHSSFDVVVVGAGFSGLYQLYRLRQEGFSVRLVEAASGLGGVWQNNRYPGARVDSHVPNYEYSIEAVWRDWTWTERFPGRDELVAYFDHVDRVLDLSPDIDLDTRISVAHFDAERDRWDLATDDGRRYDCRYLVMCLGFGSKPYVPDLPGLDSFGGRCHHTAMWPEAGVDVAGKRVGIVGTGASGVQVVQEVAPVAGHLTVFQRTPVLAIPMQQERFDRDEQIAAKVDYPERLARRNAPPGSFEDLQRVEMSALDATPEFRTEVFERAWQLGGFHFWAATFNDITIDEDANLLAYEFWRDKTRARIDDPAVADVLAPMEPPYAFGTKRPSLEQNYFDLFNLPTVDIVDVRATPIESVTPTGVRTAAADIDLDVLVLATGFDANTGGLTAIDLRGTSGGTLAEAWSGGVDTHLGMAIPGFPNLLMLYGPQSTTAFCNGPVCAEIQGEWTVDFLDHLRRHGTRRFDADPEVAAAWSATLDAVADRTLFGATDSWYMAANIPGKRRQLLNYPLVDDYRGRLSACAEAGYAGFALT